MTIARPITVAGCQITQNIGNRKANIRSAMDAIRAKPGHDIYVLPELSSCGYGEAVFNRLEDFAEDWAGPSFEAFSRVAGDRSVRLAPGGSKMMAVQIRDRGTRLYLRLKRPF